MWTPGNRSLRNVFLVPKKDTKISRSEPLNLQRQLHYLVVGNWSMRCIHHFEASCIVFNLASKWARFVTARCIELQFERYSLRCSPRTRLTTHLPAEKMIASLVADVYLFWVSVRFTSDSRYCHGKWRINDESYCAGFDCCTRDSSSELWSPSCDQSQCAIFYANACVTVVMSREAIKT